MAAQPAAIDKYYSYTYVNYVALRHPLNPAVARRLAIVIVEDGTVVLRRHCRNRMTQHNVTEDEIHQCIRGVFEPAEFENDEWRYRCRMLPIYAVVAFISEDELHVVTTWRRKR